MDEDNQKKVLLVSQILKIERSMDMMVMTLCFKNIQIFHMFCINVAWTFKNCPSKLLLQHTQGLQQLGISPFTLGELLPFFFFNNNLNPC